MKVNFYTYPHIGSDMKVNVYTYPHIGSDMNFSPTLKTSKTYYISKILVL